MPASELSQSEKPGIQIKWLSVPADFSGRSGEEEGEPADMEQEMVVDPAQHRAGSVPAGDSAANLPKGHNGSGGERPENINDKIRDQADASRNAGGSSGPERSAVVQL